MSFFKNTPFNIYTSDTDYLVQTELAGIRPEDIEVYIERDHLVIKAKRPIPEGTLLVGERSEASFTRKLRLDPSIDTRDIRANYDSGLLSLSLSKQAKRIEVKIA